MRLKRLIHPILLVCLCLTACNDDDPIQPEHDKGENTNKNPSNIAYSDRMEIPRLKDGNNLFLVKKAKLNDSRQEEFVNFCVEYDFGKRSTRWTAFRWDINNVVDRNAGYDGNFTEDLDIPAQYRVYKSDHSNNGYERGHMLASEDRQCSKDANKQTFLLSNIQPQYHAFNGYDDNPKRTNYVWLNLEQRIRQLYKGWTTAANGQDTIYVVKGGTMDNRDQILEVTQKGLVVPKYFYVALLYKNGKSTTYGGYKAIAFWIEHTRGNTTAGDDLKKYCISIDDLEKRTGIDFFCNLPDGIENVVEASAVPTAWGFK